jgi:hypothetical protein
MPCNINQRMLAEHVAVTDFGRDHENVNGCGRLWRVETDATGAIVLTGAVARMMH